MTVSDCVNGNHIFRYHKNVSSWDSSVGIAISWKAEVRFLARAIDYSLLHSVKTSSGAAGVCSMDIGDISQRIKRQSVKLITHPYPLSRSRTMELYIHSSIRFHGVVPN
jgi:hypothetical protein